MIYLYTFSGSRYDLTEVFTNEASVQFFLKANQHYPIQRDLGHYNNIYLDNVDMRKAHGNNALPYLFLDERGNIIDIIHLLNAPMPRESQRQALTGPRRKKWRGFRARRTVFHEQGMRRHRNHSPRRIHYRHLLRGAVDTEYRAYHRRPCKGSSWAYIERFQHKPCCWKDQTHRTHQWKAN